MAYDTEHHQRELVLDLRMTQVTILDEVLKRISSSRQEENFVDWCKALEDLYIEIDKKFTKKERKEYLKKVDDCYKILNQYESAYFGQSKDPKEIFEIKIALKTLEIWIRRKMEKHNFWGKPRGVEGL